MNIEDLKMDKSNLYYSNDEECCDEECCLKSNENELVIQLLKEIRDSINEIKTYMKEV